METEARDSTADPRRITTRDQLALGLTRLREHAGLTVRDVARRVGVPVGTVSGYFSGRHVPPASATQLVRDVLAACGCERPDDVEAWLDAVARVRRAPGRRPAGGPVPYRGLAGFQAEDTEWFYGRERLTADLVGLVTSRRTAHPVVVVGASGSGKSSLLRAGLVPALTGCPLDGGRQARCLVLTPRPHPMLSLADALAPAAGLSAGDLRAPDAARLVELVREVTDGTDVTVVLIVDQAEELFTVADPAEAAAFVAALRALADPSVPHVRVVLALRSDFYSSAMRMPDLLPALQHAQLVVGPMDADDLRRAIVQPAARAGADVEPGLVDVLLRDLAPAGAARGASAVAAHDDGALPLLSHALLATWERGSRRRLTVADYAAVGGIDGAVSTTAEQLWSQLDPEAQGVARRLLLRLVHVVDGVAVARRRVARAELPPGFEPIVARFVDGRLLTARDDTVEIAHEALMRAWPRLCDWIDEDQVGLRLRRALGDAAATWHDNGRDPHLLHRGAPLEATRLWVDDHAHRGDLTPLEREFLDASVEHTAAQQAEQARQQRRLRLLATTLAVLLLLATCLAALSFRESREARRHRDLAVSRQLATTTDRVGTTDVALARQLALAAFRISPTEEARSSLLSLTAAAAPTRVPVTDGVLQAVAFSADGRRVVAAGAGGALRMWRVRDRHDLSTGGTALSGASGTVYSATFSPDGRLVAAGGSDAKVRVWDVAGGGGPRLVATLGGLGNTVYSVTFSGDGRMLAAGSADGTVSTWPVRPDGDVEQPPHVVRVGAGTAVQAIAAARTGELRAAAVGDDVVLADVATGRVLPRRLTGATGTVTSLAFSPDGRTLAAGSQDRTVRLWDVTRPEQPRLVGAPLAAATNWVNSVAFSPDGRMLLAGSSDNEARLWDVATQTVREVLPHPAPVTAVAVASDGRTVATGANDGFARLWTVPGPSVTAGRTNVFGVAYLRPGVLASAGSDGVHTWAVDGGGLRALAGPVGAPPPYARLSGAIAAGRGGRVLAAAGADGTVHLLDVSDPAHPVVTATLTAGKAMVEMVAFSGDGRLLAAGGDDATVTVWDMTRPGRPRVAHLTGPSSYVNSVAFSPDGRLLAAGSADDTVRLWDVSDPERPRLVAPPLIGPRSYVYSVAFSPDGRTLAAGSDDKQVWLWDVSTPSRPRAMSPLTGPDSFVYCVAFASDGHTLAAASGDGGVWLYDVTAPAHARDTATLTGATGALFTVAFSPDAGAVVAGGADKMLRLWQTSTADAARETCAAPGVRLSRREWARYAAGVAYRDPC